MKLRRPVHSASSIVLDFTLNHAYRPARRPAECEAWGALERFKRERILGCGRGSPGLPWPPSASKATDARMGRCGDRGVRFGWWRGSRPVAAAAAGVGALCAAGVGALADSTERAQVEDYLNDKYNLNGGATGGGPGTLMDNDEFGTPIGAGSTDRYRWLGAKQRNTSHALRGHRDGRPSLRPPTRCSCRLRRGRSEGTWPSRPRRL
jgi:hypothetical protein